MERMIDNTEELIVVDADSMCLIDTDTGEVVGYSITPPDEVDTIKLAEWIGEHVTQHAATAAGLRSEKQLWIDTINARFDSRIKAHEGAVVFLKEHWYDRLYELATTLIGDGKKRSVAVGLLSLKLRKSSEKMEIVDPEMALAYCLKNQPDAVKTTQSVLVSNLDLDKWSCAGESTKLVIE